MELKTEVRIRNRETGALSTLCTGVSLDNALRWLTFSFQTMDFSNMPEYVIRPMITKTVPVQKKKEGPNA